MNDFNLLIYFVILNLIIIIFFTKLKHIISVKDYPNKRKLHAKPIPLLGGPILLINLSFYALLTHLEVINFDFEINAKLFYLYCLIIFVLGIVDDIFSINPNIKLTGFIIIFFSYCFLDNSILIQEISLSFRPSNIYLGNYSYFFTVICFLAFINAFNMFDGINLQSTSYSIFLTLYLLYSSYNSFFFLLIVFLIFFSILNFKNKSFLGNSGSYLLPFIFSVIFIHNHNFQNYNADLIFVLMSIPGFELLRLTIYRISRGKHPFYPDRNHIHHLMMLKYSNFSAVLFLNLLIYLQLILYNIFRQSIFSIFLGLLVYIGIIFFLIKKNK